MTNDGRPRAPRNEPAITATFSGALQRPASSAERPISSCWYSSARNIADDVDPVRAAAVTAAGMKPGRRIAHGGRIGCGARRSTTTKPASATAPPPKDASATGSAMPRDSTSVKPSTVNASPIVTATAPPRSSDVRGPRLSSSTRAISATATRQSGTLTRKTARQPSASVSTPPSTQPEAPPPAAAAVHHATARRRSAGSANATVSRASAAGAASAAPTPCTPRLATSTAGEFASPQERDAAPNSARPSANRRRRPNRSPARPAATSSPPNASV